MRSIRVGHAARAAAAAALLLAVLVPQALTSSASAAPPPSSAGDVSETGPTALRVDGREHPVDVEVSTPLRFTWQLSVPAQRAYQVQLAQTPDALSAGRTLWDSGQVPSPDQAVSYSGPALSGSERYSWRVRVWESDQAPTPWSAPAHFGTGPGSDWSGAVPVWAPPAPQFGDYSLRATIRITEISAGLVFRAQNTSNYFMWQFRASNASNPDVLVPHVKTNGAFTALPAVALPGGAAPDLDHQVRIDVSGPVITTWWNGRQIDTRVDPRHAAGTVGVRTGGTETFQLDQIDVVAAGGEVLYTNDYSTSGTCGTVTSGRLSVGKSTECLMTNASTDWAFMRDEVPVADKPVEWAHVYATGSSPEPARQFVYKLHLNGEFVGLGPTRSIGGEVRYDGFDVTALVRPGVNALSALAHTTTDQRFLARLVVRYTDGTTSTYGTGGHWRSLRGGDAFAAAGSIGTSYYAAPKEHLQSASFPHGFDRPAFDDSRWESAAVKPAFARLVSTPTAKVEQQLHLPVALEEVSPGSYRLDYGRSWIGGVRLDLTGRAGQAVDLRFGEVRNADGTVRHRLSAGNDYHDRWTLRDGRQQLETWGLRVFRYLDVAGAPSGLTADDFPAVAHVYPFEADGAAFSSSSDALNKVWTLSRNTIEALNMNMYADTWTRERDNYEADAYLQQLAHLHLSTDASLGDYSMDYFTEGRRTWPTEWPMYVILGHHASWQHTGDTSALSENYEALKAKLPSQWIESSTGLVRKLSGSNGCNSTTDCDIVDWPTSERDGYQFRQYNTVINAIAYRSFRDMAEIAAVLGKTADADSFAQTADRLRSAMNARLWDDARGAYRDGLNTDGTPVQNFAVHATAFSAAFGVPADTRQYQRAADYLQTRGMVCSVYCAGFLLPALYDGDRGDAALGLLTSDGRRSWLNMIKAGAGATMEAWDVSLKSNTTYSHPWAASPASTVPRGLFGIKATTPGFDSFDIRPQPAGLEWANVAVPTVKGRVAAAFAGDGGRTDVGVHVPGGTTARVFVPAGQQDEAVVYVDGRPRDAVTDGAYLRVDGITPGCHVLSSAPGAPQRLSPRLTELCPDGYRPPDYEPPTFTEPERVHRDATNVHGARVAYAAPTATDDVDGPVPVSCAPASGTSFPLGETEVVCSAADSSGNSASLAFPATVTYAWSGLLDPVAADGSSEVRRDSTVPLKFVLTGGSSGVTDAVATATVVRIEDGAPVGEPQIAAPATATQGSTFRYDPASAQYVYGWSTRELEPGTYEVAVDMGDGASRTTRVTLR